MDEAVKLGAWDSPVEIIERTHEGASRSNNPVKDRIDQCGGGARRLTHEQFACVWIFVCQDYLEGAIEASTGMPDALYVFQEHAAKVAALIRREATRIEAAADETRIGDEAERAAELRGIADRLEKVPDFCTAATAPYALGPGAKVRTIDSEEDAGAAVTDIEFQILKLFLIENSKPISSLMHMGRGAVWREVYATEPGKKQRRQRDTIRKALDRLNQSLSEARVAYEFKIERDEIVRKRV